MAVKPKKLSIKDIKDISLSQKRGNYSPEMSKKSTIFIEQLPTSQEEMNLGV